MRLLSSLFFAGLFLYFLSNPAGAEKDVVTLFQHALPFVKQSLQTVLHSIQNIQNFRR